MAHATDIKLFQKKRILSVFFDNGESFDLPCEYLRVFSPSAEVRGHGSNQGTLQAGKKFVNVIAIEPVGQYAIKLIFDDGHDSGIYSWQTLLDLGQNYQQNWQKYLEKLKQANLSRE